MYFGANSISHTGYMFLNLLITACIYFAQNGINHGNSIYTSGEAVFRPEKHCMLDCEAKG